MVTDLGVVDAHNVHAAVFPRLVRQRPRVELKKFEQSVVQFPSPDLPLSVERTNSFRTLTIDSVELPHLQTPSDEHS